MVDRKWTLRLLVGVAGSCVELASAYLCLTQRCVLLLCGSYGGK